MHTLFRVRPSSYLPVVTIVCVLTVTLMALAGCSKSSTSEVKTRTIIASAANSFAEYKPVPVNYTPAVAMEPVKPDFSNVYKYNGNYFSPSEKELLKKNLFLAKPNHLNMSDLYKENYLPAFISADAVLHAYHQVFDSTLVQSEEKLYKNLKQLSVEMCRASVKQYEEARDTKTRDAALNNVAYFGVAVRLLGVPIETSEEPRYPWITAMPRAYANVDYGEEPITVPASAKKLIQAEFDLIEKHVGLTSSPIFGYGEDYSQFVPRGHYTNSDDLKRYFRAMIWYGRMNFHLRMIPADPELIKQHTRQAILITRALETTKHGTGTALDLWHTIYDPTAFFIGYSDDLNARDYMGLVQKVYGDNPTDKTLADDKLLQSFIDKAVKLRLPKISSTGAGFSPEDTMGFKFLGQRFVPDSYIFEELVYMKTGRLMPKGLDIPAVLGSKRAYDILDITYEETKDKAYTSQIAKLQNEFSHLPGDAWTQNLYWGWLHSITTLLGDRPEGYPQFMRSRAWQDKSLTTFLGSWTELRHDTILYAKPSETQLALAGFPGEPKPVNAYVEPNPELYARLLALTQMMQSGLKKRELLDDKSELQTRLAELVHLLSTCKSASEEELSGKRISKDEEKYLEGFGDILDRFSYPINDNPDRNDWDQNHDELVADVHTDPNSKTCLEEATGKPMELFVIAPVDGKPALFRGGAFSYYEFTKPVSKRLTDEDWRAIAGTERGPDLPSWMESFVSGTE